MNFICIRCNPKATIAIPDFDLETKIKLLNCKKESPLIFIKLLVNNYGISLVDAKTIVLHLNTTYGHCNRCNNNELYEENIACPKCKGFNFNWKIE